MKRSQGDDDAPSAKRAREEEGTNLGMGGYKAGYLAGARDDWVYHVNRPSDKGCPKPLFEGTLEELVESIQSPEMQRMAKNKVKVCECGKAVAFTLNTCNGCGNSIVDVPLSYSDNIFTGFMFGVKKGKFPFTISLRFEDEDFVCFDDLLVLCPCHLNIIPTSKYIPDWRFLLRRPKEGLALINDMYDRALTVAREQYWSNAEWRAGVLTAAATAEDLNGAVMAGFNYPPSQYQLHLQFMTSPFMPFHYNAFLNGIHYTKGRFFPVEYVMAVLELDVAYEVTEDTPIEDIIAFYKEKGVDYDAVHAEQFARYDDSHRRLGRYNPRNFAGVVHDSTFHEFSSTLLSGAAGPSLALTPSPADFEVKKLDQKDKGTMQNYGRPYSESGKPTGVYYSFAKSSPDQIDAW